MQVFSSSDSTSTLYTHNDMTCFYRVQFLTSIDPAIKLYTQSISRNTRKKLNIKLIHFMVFATKLKRTI